MSIISRAFDNNGAPASDKPYVFAPSAGFPHVGFRAVIDFQAPMPPVAAEPMIKPWQPPFRLPSGPVIADPRRVSAASGHGCIVFAMGETPFEDAAADSVAESWLQAYVRDGVDMFTRARQAHAVVLIDFGRKKVLAGVDRFARESLCYTVDRGALIVSDRADGCATGSTNLNLQALYDYLSFHVVPTPLTIFQHVYRLPGAHHLSFDGKHVDVHRSWTPQFVEWGDVNYAALKDEFYGLLGDAVSMRLARAKHIGCFLSGGTDSSTVVGMVGKVRGESAQSFSIGFDAEGYDEMSYARIAAKAFKADHHEYYVTPDDVRNDMPKVAAYYDQPFGNSSALAGYHCARVAKQAGVTMMFAGDGGDELFGGNTRYAEQKLFLPYEALPSWLRSGVIEPMMLDKPWMKQVPGLRQLSGYVRYGRMPMPDRMEAFNLLDWLGADKLLTGELLSKVDIQHPRQLQREVYNSHQADNQANRMMAYDWRFTLADNDLPKVNGTTRMAGVDVCYPLLDDKLLEFSLKLPPSYKIKGRKLRWFFKEALRGFLPDEILTKSKHGFGLPFGPWLHKDPQMQAMAEEAIASLSELRLVNADFTRHVLKDRMGEHPGYVGSIIWVLMMLAFWLDANGKKRSIQL